MTDAKFKAAIIGTGRMGGLMEDENPYTNQYSKPYSHFVCYGAIEETEVVAVANRGAPRLERFSKRFGITNTYLDYEEMILKEKPDIVSVTTPSYARAEPIIFAAENGVRGIYAEKGLCASLEEADRITKAVTDNNVAFNWGASRRHHSAWRQLAAAIAKGDIGEPKFAVSYTLTDLIKHHPHTLDTVSLLLGDPVATWVQGSLVQKGSALDGQINRMGPRDGETYERTGPLPNPDYDAKGHRFVPPPGQEIADPMVGFYRVGYDNGAEGVFVPVGGRWSIDVQGTDGSVHGWEQQGSFSVRSWSGRGGEIKERIITPEGESPTVNTIRNIVRELETGERTYGNIEVTMQVVEPEFGIAHSSLEGGSRVSLPVTDRSLYIPGG